MHAIEIEGRNEGKSPPPTMGTVSSSSASSPPPVYRLIDQAKSDTTRIQVDDLEKGVVSKKLKLLPLIFLIYFEVSGGPFGEEPAVKAAGPLLAILGFLLFPFIWSIPEALITAELATAYPGNGGYVIWADAAFGPFWGFQMGATKFLSGVINNAAYPVLCVDYLKLLFKVFGSGWPRKVAISFATLVLSFLNYTGLTIVGYTAVALAVISIAPFILLACCSIPKLHPRRWISMGEPGLKKDWNLYFNTLFWNLNFWDNASTLAGEVDKPQKTFPKALFSAGMIACIGYLIPLLAIIGALPLDQNSWDTGYLAEGAGMIAGGWLKGWVTVGAFLSTIGLFQAQLSSSSFQLLGMADIGFLPKIFALRSTWFNTPWVGILCCSAITLGVSNMDFTNIISSANFLYSLAMLLEFSAFVWLRRKRPELVRPFKVPLGIPALVVILMIPSGFLIYVMCIATPIVYMLSASLIGVGIIAYFVMNFCKSHSCLQFNTREEYESQKKGSAEAVET